MPRRTRTLPGGRRSRTAAALRPTRPAVAYSSFPLPNHSGLGDAQRPRTVIHDAHGPLLDQPKVVDDRLGVVARLRRAVVGGCLDHRRDPVSQVVTHARFLPPRISAMFLTSAGLTAR